MSKIKENIHILLLLNLVLTFILFFSTESPVNLIIINGKKETSTEKNLREVICKKAFETWQEDKISDYYIHPDVILEINNNPEKFNIKKVEKFYFSMEGREICRVVARRKKGFSAFEAVISKNGPLIYRITNIKPEKPTYTEIKGYL